MTAAVLALALAAGWPTWGGDGSRAGFAPDPVGAGLHGSFRVPLEGRVTGQVVADPSGTLYVATSAGFVYAVSGRGYVRWTADVGQLAHACPQLDGYGVTGTPTLSNGRLYVADAFGRLHALAVATGLELPGWPVRAVSDFRHELVWGSLLAARGRIYLATGSYCDTGPMSGRVYAVDEASRAVTSWTAVPAALGGGGGIWGWGGIAWSERRGALYAVTGNAFGPTEWAGFGEQLVELSPELAVRASSLPDPASVADADFVGSPVVGGTCIAAVRKDARLFVWRDDAIAEGPTAALSLERYDPADPVLSQAAYDPALASLFVSTGARLVRVVLGPGCAARIAWSHPLGTTSENGSPTIAGGTVWLTTSGSPALVGYDAASGRREFRLPLGGLVLTAPTVLPGRLLVGSFAGALYGFVARGAPAVPAVPASEVPGHSSHGWVSRDDGVWTAGRRILTGPALAVTRTSARAGIVSVGAGTCRCRSRQLWTRDGGRHWYRTSVVGGHFAGRGRLLFWRDDAGTALSQVRPWPPRGRRLRSRTVARVRAGRIVDLAPVRGGVAALISSRRAGQGWDTAPRVLVWRAGRVATVTLPATTGLVLVRRIVAAGASLVVQGADFAGVATQPVTWSSADGGRTWHLTRGPVVRRSLP